MLEAVIAHWGIEMIATFMYIGLVAICTDPKHGHNKVLVWMGNNRLATQAMLALPVAWITVLLVDRLLLGSGVADEHGHGH